MGDSEIADDLGDCGKEHLLWRPIANRLKEAHGITKTSDGKRLDIRHIKGQLWSQLRDYWLISEPPTRTEDDLFEKYKLEIDRCKRIYRIIFLDELALRFYDTLRTNPSFRQDVAVPRIVIDEFQDLNPTEHGIIQQFNEVGTTFAVFGDDDQAINDFRRAHADYIRQFKSVYSPKEYPLPRDRRCPRQILDLADDFVRGIVRLPKPSGFAMHDGRVDILSFTNDEAEKSGVVELVSKYSSLASHPSENPQILVLCGSLGTITGKTRTAEIIESLKKSNLQGITGEAKENPLDNDWGLAFQSLVRMAVHGTSPMNLGAFLSTAYPTLTKSIKDLIESEERKGNILDFGTAFSSLAKVDSTAKNLSNNLQNLKPALARMDFDLSQIMALIPNNLDGRLVSEPIVRSIWENSQNLLREKDFSSNSGDDARIHALQQALRIFVGDIRKPEVGRIHATTYRKAKGLEADLVIVTSVDSRDFYPTDQTRRLLYVAATRAKLNLILTFAKKRTKARIYAHGGAGKSNRSPVVLRSSIVPARYVTQPYSRDWLDEWNPILAPVSTT